MSEKGKSFRIALIGLLVFIIFKYVQVLIVHQGNMVATANFMQLGTGVAMFIIITLTMAGVYLPYHKQIKNKQAIERVSFIG